MDELISRQKAINVIERTRAYIGHNMERAVGAAFIEILDDVGEDIGRLPFIQLATDTNVGTKLGTNLAEVGTDCISRQDAIEAVQNRHMMLSKEKVLLINDLKKLPPAQPEIIYCKDCVKHNKGLGNYEVHHDGSTTWIWKDSACPLVSWRDKAQGHEFDYQFCAYAERKEVTT